MKTLFLSIVLMLGHVAPASVYAENNGPNAGTSPRYAGSLPSYEGTSKSKFSQAEPPASPFALSGHYSFARREWSAIATTTFDPLWENIGGKTGFNIELYGLAGGNADAGIIGGGIGLVYPIHPRISLRAGFDVTKRGTTFEEFFGDFKGFEIGGTVGVLYWMRF